MEKITFKIFSLLKSDCLIVGSRREGSINHSVLILGQQDNGTVPGIDGMSTYYVTWVDFETNQFNIAFQELNDFVKVHGFIPFFC